MEAVLDSVRGSWSPEEDAMLVRLVNQHGPCNWALISAQIPGRSGKSCRLRWINQLDPTVQHRPFSAAEDAVILKAHAVYGNRWATIAHHLPGRTDNAVKNHWNSTLSRRCKAESPVKEEAESNSSTSSELDSRVKRMRFQVAMDGPETSLTLSPPGACGEKVVEKEKIVVKREEGWMKGSGDEEADGKSKALINLMRRMIEEEVRRCIDGLLVSKHS